ncbi:alpha/beta-hydrolase [Dichomitus squalens]|uniref:Alpha/beta-hydrolase n=1 Tax=Dichomitus squalens TaxID=114155 RepID=A0A4Q9MF99_9APHY|nr:alpha/beta-hydrolase [Dichomitus squalens]
MDVVATFKETTIPVILDPTKHAFTKILENRRSEIEGYPHQTFQFGTTDRHQVSPCITQSYVFYPDPAAVSSGGPIPVLFFVYGGGFTSGDRKQAPPFDLGYTNVGVFFAKRGILTVIPDYRLHPSVNYPAPVEDVRDALAWFLANPSVVTSASNGTLSSTADISTLFVMGHSAGSNHVASLYLSPSLLPIDSPVRAATRGLLPAGGAYVFSFPNAVTPPGLLEAYYGSQEAALDNMPLTLLKRASEELIKSLPEFFVLKSEHEPEAISKGNDEFVEALEGRLGKKVQYEIMKRHNHISPHWALLSGDGEDWGEDVAVWVKARI